MTTTKLIAAIALLALTIALIAAILDTASLILSIAFFSAPTSGHLVRLITLASAFVVAFAALYWLLCKSDCIADKIAGPQPPDSSQLNSLWVLASLRAVLCFCGFMLLLYGGAKGLSQLLVHAFIAVDRIADMIIYHRTLAISDKSNAFLLKDLLAAVKGLLALYLLLGAPRLTRYWIRKQTSNPTAACPQH